jgi:hypothetical protein
MWVHEKYFSSDNHNGRTVCASGQVLHVYAARHKADRTVCLSVVEGTTLWAVALGNIVPERETAASWGEGEKRCFVILFYVFLLALVIRVSNMY